MRPHWLEISKEEFSGLFDAAYQAMRDEWDVPTRCLRHLMNAVLFYQLITVRDLIDSGAIHKGDAASTMSSDPCVGYLVGLAANYKDACDLAQDASETRAAIYDVYTFTFGPEEGARIIHSHSTSMKTSEEFISGMERAHKDVNSFKRFLKGTEPTCSTGLVDQIYSALRTSAQGTPPQG